ncbi:MAG: uracil-DNA glycosylase [Christensenellaceae bacterium]
MVDLGDWNELLAPLFKDERYVQIRKFLFEEYNNYTVYPDMYDLYNCFRYTPFKDVKAVLLGQDPYHNEGQAHGLCFSVKDGVEKPPSLENIFKELQSDLGCDVPRSGNLTKWARQGVLMMNTSLTVRAHRAEFPFQMRLGLVYGQRNSADFRKKEHVVFILWGGNARSKSRSSIRTSI